VPQRIGCLVRLRADPFQDSLGHRSGWRDAEEAAEIHIYILAWLRQPDKALLQQRGYGLNQLLGGNPLGEPGNIGDAQLAVEQNQELQCGRGNLSRAPHQFSGRLFRWGIDIEDICSFPNSWTLHFFANGYGVSWRLTIMGFSRFAKRQPDQCKQNHLGAGFSAWLSAPATSLANRT